MNPRAAIALVMFFVDGSNLRGELFVLSSSLRRFASKPRIVAARRNAQQVAHHRNRVVCLLRVNELEALYEFSFAKKAALNSTCQGNISPKPSAGVLKPSVFLGRLFSWRATRSNAC